MEIPRQSSSVEINKGQEQPEKVEYFKYLGSVITNDARCRREIKSRISMAKVAFNKNNNLFTIKLDLNLRKKVVQCYIWSKALYGAETWTLHKVDQKYLESSEMWCLRRMQKISWTDRVINEVLKRVKEERNILQRIRRIKANSICHIFRRNWLLKCVFKEKIEESIAVTGRRGRRPKQLLNCLRIQEFEKEFLGRTVLRTRFARGYGPVLRWKPNERIN